MGEVTHARIAEPPAAENIHRKFTLCSCAPETRRHVDQRSREVFIKQTQLPQDKPLTRCTQRPGSASAQPRVCSTSRWCGWKASVGANRRSTFGTSPLWPFFPVPLRQLVGSTLPPERSHCGSWEPASSAQTSSLASARMPQHGPASRLCSACSTTARLWDKIWEDFRNRMGK